MPEGGARRPGGSAAVSAIDASNDAPRSLTCSYHAPSASGMERDDTPTLWYLKRFRDPPGPVLVTSAGSRRTIEQQALPYPLRMETQDVSGW
jgi:hypothetical protein